jgi:hypothetical protein
MATAWAGLAFSRDFVSPTDEQVGPTSSENSEAAPVENIVSSGVDNEQIDAIRNAQVDVERQRIGQVTDRGPTELDAQWYLNELTMPNVDWLALWDEFAQATDNEQLEVAERIVYHDGRWNFTELSSSKLIAAARQIIRERIEGRS